MAAFFVFVAAVDRNGAAAGKCRVQCVLEVDSVDPAATGIGFETYIPFTVNTNQAAVAIRAAAVTAAADAGFTIVGQDVGLGFCLPTVI